MGGPPNQTIGPPMGGPQMGGPPMGGPPLGGPPMGYPAPYGGPVTEGPGTQVPVTQVPGTRNGFRRDELVRVKVPKNELTRVPAALSAVNLRTGTS